MTDSKYVFKIKFERTQTAVERTFPFLEYTEYIIKISTEDSSWKIVRRYKDFFRVHIKNKANFNFLPPFPRKKLFPMRDTVINERIILLENYLNYIFSEVKILIINKKYEYLYIFLGLDDIKNNLSETVSLNTTSAFTPNFFIQPSRRDSKLTNLPPNPGKIIKFISSQKEDCIIEPSIVYNPCPIIKYSKVSLGDFLIKINLDTDNLSNYCQEFFLSLSKSLNDLTQQDIYRLYFGERNDKEILNGIIYFTGKFQEYSIGSILCLFIINASIQFEFNSQNEKFIGVLKKASISQMKKLNVKGFFKLNNPDYLKKCFFIISIWNSSFDNNDNLDEVFDDEELFQAYEEYTRVN